jgi:hypothetical protein
MSFKKLSFMLLSAVSLAALLNGCGSSNKDASPGGVARVASEGVCIVCHSSTTSSTSGTNIVAAYANSSHNPQNVSFAEGCEGCHGGGSQHNGVGPFPYPDPLTSNRCITCHTTEHSINGNDLTPLFALAQATNFNGATCAHCHTASGVDSVHGAGKQTNVNKGCVDCHDITGPNHGATLVSDNSGVRPIVPEFNKTSHHIVNATGGPTNAQCAVCHMEGQTGGAVNTLYHMTDGKIHLRNGNTTLAGNTTMATAGVDATAAAQYAWDPATPNHTLMDQFCMSCHNAAGAPAAVGVVTGNSATNPFKDTISNGYDQMSRSVVVPVFNQFDTGNSSHHAVRGQKYSGRTRATTANPAVFTKYSGAAVSPGTVAPLKNGNAGIGPLSPGSRYTIYEAGFFVSNYTPLGATKTVGDDSTLHCGDCHTVGVWKPNSTTAVTSNLDGTTTQVTNLAAIGAHGSNNEYMLRTSDGVDALHHQNPVDGTSIANQNVGGTYVCFLCHRQGVYGSDEQYQRYAANPAAYPVPATYATSRLGGHGGLHPCNAPVYESVGMAGSDRIFHIASVAGDGGGGGNLFGYTCGNCHNSGNKGFGGIHGSSNVVWGTYSASGGYATAASTNANVAITNRQSYRFMGGLSLRYNGGATPAKWESQTLQVSNREGCYNFTVPPTGTAGVTANNNEWAIGNAANEFTDGANANQTFGSWGGCAQHNGSIISGAGEPGLRKVQRPLSY